MVCCSDSFAKTNSVYKKQFRTNKVNICKTGKRKLDFSLYNLI